MNHVEDIRPITDLKTRAAELIGEVRRTRRPLFITQRGRAKAVLLDVDEYRKLRDGVLLLKGIALSEEDIERGRVEPQAEVFEAVRRSLAPA